jgi:hypothetical protein
VADSSKSGAAKQLPKIAVTLTDEKDAREFDKTWQYDVNGPQARGFIRVWRGKETYYFPIERIRLVITVN